jgi:hypothetical protein
MYRMNYRSMVVTPAVSGSRMGMRDYVTANQDCRIESLAGDPLVAVAVDSLMVLAMFSYARVIPTTQNVCWNIQR